MKSKERRYLGKLPPKFSFSMNPYLDCKFSRCPRCNKLTFQRKFPLFIVVEKNYFLTLGKTCCYCSSCELIICSTHEIEPTIFEFAKNMGISKTNPEYLIIGTVKSSFFKEFEGKKTDLTLSEMFDSVSDFKEHLQVKYTPRMWVKNTK